jgi:hypothetical protein
VEFESKQSRAVQQQHQQRQPPQHCAHTPRSADMLVELRGHSGVYLAARALGRILCLERGHGTSTVVNLPCALALRRR